MAEERRRFDLERRDALQAAKQKKKGGMFGFIGKALGVGLDFIPAPGFIKNAAKNSVGRVLRGG